MPTSDLFYPLKAGQLSPYPHAAYVYVCARVRHPFLFLYEIHTLPFIFSLAFALPSKNPAICNMQSNQIQSNPSLNFLEMK